MHKQPCIPNYSQCTYKGAKPLEKRFLTDHISVTMTVLNLQLCIFIIVPRNCCFQFHFITLRTFSVLCRHTHTAWRSWNAPGEEQRAKPGQCRGATAVVAQRRSWKVTGAASVPCPACSQRQLLPRAGCGAARGWSLPCSQRERGPGC